MCVCACEGEKKSEEKETFGVRVCSSAWRRLCIRGALPRRATLCRASGPALVLSVSFDYRDIAFTHTQRHAQNKTRTHTPDPKDVGCKTSHLRENIGTGTAGTFFFFFFLNMILSLPLVQSCCCCFVCPLHLPINAHSSHIHQLNFNSLSGVISLHDHCTGTPLSHKTIPVESKHQTF